MLFRGTLDGGALDVLGDPAKLGITHDMYLYVCIDTVYGMFV